MKKPLEEIIEEIREFNQLRDWSKFHDAKNLAIALSIEASELLELFLWDRDKNINTDHLKDELADVLIYALILADRKNLDITEIIQEKIKKNKQRYPVVSSKGNSAKSDI